MDKKRKNKMKGNINFRFCFGIAGSEFLFFFDSFDTSMMQWDFISIKIAIANKEVFRFRIGEKGKFANEPR